MNMPSTTSGNWAWRYRADALTDKVADRLQKLTQIYGREQKPKGE